MNNENNFDFIAIGDSVVEPFIRLQEGHIQETSKGAELCIPYGAKIPYESSTLISGVGNSANAAVSAARLGVKTALLTWVGNDSYGEDCKKHFADEGISNAFIQSQDGKNTNYHYVLWHGDDRTILVKHEAFDYSMPDIGSPTWIYLSSLAAHTEGFHDEITAYLKSHPEVKLAFQPGTFQLKLGHAIDELYKEVDVLCMNKEEAEALLDSYTDDMKVLLNGLEALGPKTVIVTDGHQGSYMKYDNSYFQMPIYPDIAPPYERTGAGDAFFSTFVSYLAKGYDAPYAIKRAPINSASVVLKVGAQEGLLNEEKLEEYLKAAPKEYTLSIME